MQILIATGNMHKLSELSRVLPTVLPSGEKIEYKLYQKGVFAKIEIKLIKLMPENEDIYAKLAEERYKAEEKEKAANVHEFQTVVLDGLSRSLDDVVHLVTEFTQRGIAVGESFL